MNYIAIDIGGTKTLLAVFNSEGQIIEQIKFQTPKNYDEFLLEVKENASNLENKEFLSGAIGTRGLVDREKVSIIDINDGVLEWPHTNIGEDFSNIFGTNFSIENDSKLAGLSEAALVNKATYRKVLYMTVSTGIGTVFVVDGILDPNLINSEVGKWIFRHDGQIQTWENFASGKAIVEKYGKKASELEDPEAWRAISENLALGIVNISAAYTPDLIIVGGGVGQHLEKFVGIIEEIIPTILPPFITVPKIVKAQRSEEAVIYGAYLLARQKFDA